MMRQEPVAGGGGTYNLPWKGLRGCEAGKTLPSIPTLPQPLHKTSFQQVFSVTTQALPGALKYESDV